MLCLQISIVTEGPLSFVGRVSSAVGSSGYDRNLCRFLAAEEGEAYMLPGLHSQILTCVNEDQADSKGIRAQSQDRWTLSAFEWYIMWQSEVLGLTETLTLHRSMKLPSTFGLCTVFKDILAYQGNVAGELVLPLRLDAMAKVIHY